MRHILAVAAACLLLTACATPSAAPNATITAASATVNDRLAQAQATLTTAANLWGIAKGLAMVGGVSVPPAGDALLATAQTTLDGLSTDVPAIEALAEALRAQANALTVAAAPLIKAVPG